MKSVLLIEDEPELRSLLAENLRNVGWMVYEAEDGDAGLRLARQHHPATIVCDLLLPRKNGFQVCAALRQDACFRGTGIVAMSGRGYPSNRQRALEAGADEFLPKPVQVRDLAALLDQMVHEPGGDPSGAGACPEARIRFWGVRGSVAVPGPGTVLYGGNTSCVEVRADGQILVLDCGTGIRPLGQRLVAEFGERPMKLTVLISHVHWDHIQGLPFFQPAYEPKNEIQILGYESSHSGLAAVLGRVMESPYFPIELKEFPARVSIRDLHDLSFSVGRVQVQAAFMNHPGVCMGYRLNTSAGSIAFLPDHEPFDRSGRLPGTQLLPKAAVRAYAEEEERRLLEFIQGADVLIIDAQYDAEEYKTHAGWGHGSVDEVVRLAVAAQAKQLFLFHHDPAHDDAKIASMAEHARRLVASTGASLQVEAAREGAEVALKVRGPVVQGRG